MKKLLNTINLQLFAENTNTTLDSGMSVEMKTFYDMSLIDEAQPNLIHDQFGQKRPIPANGGKTIEFRKFASLEKALTPLTEGVTPNGKKLSASKIEATVEQFGDYIVHSDVLKLTTIDNVIVEATKILGNQAGLTLDTVTREKLHACKNRFFCPKADGTAVVSRSGLDGTCKLTVDVIKKAVAFLKKNNAPKINGDYVAIIHPYAAYDIMSDEAWIDAHKYATPENIYEGEIGKIAGVRFVETSEAKVYTGDVYGTLLIGDGAYGVTEITGGGLETIIKQIGSSGVADALNQRGSIGWKAMKTAEILVEPYMVCIESKSAMSDSVVVEG